MIHYVTGDLTLSSADAIAHGVAPNDDFKNGLAQMLHERFPSMVKDFRHYCHANHPKPGSIWTWAGVGPDGKAVRVVNLLTQEPAPHAGAHPGIARLEFVNHALHELAKLAVSEGWESLALPRLASGVGGLDWNDVKPVIEKTLGRLNLDVYVYATYRAGSAATEESSHAVRPRR